MKDSLGSLSLSFSVVEADDTVCLSGVLRNRVIVYGKVSGCQNPEAQVWVGAGLSDSLHGSPVYAPTCPSPALAV